jgi:hypothetical protein
VTLGTAAEDDLDDYPRARIALQRVATHVMARSRFSADGRLGLRVTPSGIATPAYGDNREVLRVVGGTLIHELQGGDGAKSRVAEIAGRTLQELAEFAGADLESSFSAGRDPPALGDVNAPMRLDPHLAADVMAWLRVGAEAIDRLLPSFVEPSVVQLWPEHFDVAVDLATAHGRVNLGASPGDSGHPDPYLYVGPWGEDRPGETSFWNAPFGALLDGRRVLVESDRVGAAAAFFQYGLDLLS